jgi:tRNA-specific 2-thiouridylase
MKNTVLVGMSGGVDSAAAVLLLKEEGYAVRGAFLNMWGEADSSDARAVCGKLGIALDFLDAKQLFAREVIDYFADEYTAGRTPNPCARCNPAVKIKTLAEHAKNLKIEKIATGHYARTAVLNERHVLRRAFYPQKDQTYALSLLPQELLEMLLLPLGDYCKTEVRGMVQKAGLHIAAKPDSQDICFVPDGDYAGFLERLRPGENPKGNFINQDGSVIGPHRGLWNYTVGQRKGLGVALGKPVFVGGANPKTGDVTLCDDSALYKSGLTATQVNWMDREGLTASATFDVKIRYSAKPVAALLSPYGHKTVKIQFESNQRAVTPGQIAAFYSGDILSGAGMIPDNEL